MFTIDRWKMCLLLVLMSRSSCAATQKNYPLYYEQIVDYDDKDEKQKAIEDYLYPKLQKNFHIGGSQHARLKWSQLLGDRKVHQERKRSSWSTCTRRELCYCYSRVSNRYFCCDCDNGACFPSMATVHVKNKGVVTMDQLRIDDQVITVSDAGYTKYSKVLAFLDRRMHGESMYLRLTTITNQTLHLSKSHLLFITRHNTSIHHTPILAGEVLVDDEVVVPTMPGERRLAVSVKIIDIQPVLLQGAVVPVTSDGTIVVDGVLASCYTTFDHYVAHYALAPIRWLPRLFETQTSQYEDGVRPYAKVLKYLGHLMFPSSTKTGRHNRYGDDHIEIVRRPNTHRTNTLQRIVNTAVHLSIIAI